MTNEQKDPAHDNNDVETEQPQNQEDHNDLSAVSVDALQAQIVKLEEHLKLEKSRAANAIYEAEKVKERLEREADTAKKFALEKFAKSLLDSVDNLERAILAAGDEQGALLEGVQLTLKSLLTALEKQNIVVIDTANGFNAELHQAVGIAPDVAEGEIGNVLQKGYTLSGRLLRPAMVMVGQ